VDHGAALRGYRGDNCIAFFICSISSLSLTHRTDKHLDLPSLTLRVFGPPQSLYSKMQCAELILGEQLEYLKVILSECISLKHAASRQMETAPYFIRPRWNAVVQNNCVQPCECRCCRLSILVQTKENQRDRLLTLLAYAPEKFSALHWRSGPSIRIDHSSCPIYNK